jgi:thiamine transport system ATP-binding protein
VLQVDGAVVRFGAHAALDGVDLTVAPGEIVVVLGPSGSGKSTLLRAIAGLERLDAGRILWEGRDLTRLAPHERRFGLMFQDYALFPHRDVRGNVEFGLRMANVPPGRRAERVAEVLDLVGLRGYDHRRVPTLSGGEQQRVALARALAPSPRLLMLDEPLGALDRQLRERLLTELQQLLAASGLPAVYVTHDHNEAFVVADRIVVMRAGRVVQADTPGALWAAPTDAWTAEFLGFAPALDVPVEGDDAVTPWGRFAAGGADGRARVVVRPGAARLAPDGTPGATRGVVTSTTFAGDHVAVGVTVDGAPPIDVAAGAGAAPRLGETVAVEFPGDGILVYAV